MTQVLVEDLSIDTYLVMSN